MVIITAMITSTTHPPAAIAPPISSTVAATAFAAAATQKNSRWLLQAVGNGYTLSFTYNDEGIRTSKTVNGEAHRYILNGDQIVSEQWGQHLVLYIYDADGTPIGMQYHHNSHFHRQYDVYWFEKNLQGDVVAVYDEDGDKLISYAYDAWGNFTTTYHNGCTASHNANLNPFRYRGYYYDVELGMYYLQSRYYDPVIGRFISSDVFVSTGQGLLGNNMYCYCLNNPVNYTDMSGEVAISIMVAAIVGGAIAGGVISTTSYIYTTKQQGEDLQFKEGAVIFLVGAIAGGFGGAAGMVTNIGIQLALCASAGIAPCIYTVCTTGGPPEQKFWAGTAAFVITAVGAYGGAQIPLDGLSESMTFAGSAIFGGTIGGYCENLNVHVQRVIDERYNNNEALSSEWDSADEYPFGRGAWIYNNILKKNLPYA